jgi:ATP-dependent Clp protease ATP-binding subunit ClpC
MLRASALLLKNKPRQVYKPTRSYQKLRIYNGIMDNMSESSVKSILLAQVHTRYYQSNNMLSEHLLLGIMSIIQLKEEGSEELTKPIYSNLPTFTIKNVQNGIEQVFGKREFNNDYNSNILLETNENEIQISFSEEIRHILYLSEKERDLRGAQFITPESMLLIMLSLENKCRGVDVLKHIKVDISLLRDILYKDIRSLQEIVKSPNKNIDISTICKDLCKLVKDGKIDPVVGREREVNRVIRILGRKTKSNPILIGEPGVGKTAIAEGLAYKIVYEKHTLPSYMWNKQIWQLDTAAMMAGTKERGELEERITNLITLLKKSEGEIILMIDEIHTLVSPDSRSTTRSKGSEDTNTVANLFKPALARGEISCIGATTFREYTKYFQKDSAFDRRFQPVYVDQPNTEDCIAILKGIKEIYEAHHNCLYTEKALEYAVKLSIRFIPERNLPDKAIDVIDEAGSRVRIKYSNQERVVITEKDIKEIVQSWTGIPITEEDLGNYDTYIDVERNLKKEIIGQDHAIDTIMNIVKRSKVDFRDPRRPIACLLFVGPSGVGKTELVKQLAYYLFTKKEAFIRFDMSEYMEDFNISRLIGSPPGYVGFEDAGKLTEAVRRNPYSIILFDEIEKAHPSISNILLQIFEDGCLKDAKGNKVSFKNTIIVLTSNLGNSNVAIRPELQEQYTMKEINKFFKPELINRFDEIVFFKQLDKQSMYKIISKNIRETLSHIEKKGYKVILSKKLLKKIYKEGQDSNVRNIRNILKYRIEDKVTDFIIDSIDSNETTIYLDK